MHERPDRKLECGDEVENLKLKPHVYGLFTSERKSVKSHEWNCRLVRADTGSVTGPLLPIKIYEIHLAK
jgi:hypothetical protein